MNVFVFICVYFYLFNEGTLPNAAWVIRFHSPRTFFQDGKPRSLWRNHMQITAMGVFEKKKSQNLTVNMLGKQFLFSHPLSLSVTFTNLSVYYINVCVRVWELDWCICLVWSPCLTVLRVGIYKHVDKLMHMVTWVHTHTHIHANIWTHQHKYTNTHAPLHKYISVSYHATIKEQEALLRAQLSSQHTHVDTGSHTHTHTHTRTHSQTD